MKSISARISLLLMFIVMALSVTACGSSPSPDWSNLPPGNYPPHPIFEDFYLEYGGYDLFGYPISTAFSDQSGRRFQYFETVLMSFDPFTESISFEPLGLDLGLDTLPVAAWQGKDHNGDDGLIIGKFNIHPAFVPLFLRLGPERVGLPISHPFYNPSRNRMEQHFEGAGMFFLLEDAEETPSLLEYGLAACQSCQPQSNPRQKNAAIQTPPTDTSFFEQMTWANISIGLTGEVIKGPIQAVDGTTDLIFEHMALYKQDGELKIRPLPILLGFKDELYYNPINHPDLVFYPTERDAGHNVFRLFDSYIAAHGGYFIAGEPITEIFTVNRDLGQISQCFENYCLEYLPQNTVAQIRPVALGSLYLENNLQRYASAKEDQDTGKTTNQGTRHVSPFTMIVWEHPTVVDSQTPVTISVNVVMDNTPQSGLTVTLKVNLPNGVEAVYEMPPTSEDGTTSYTLTPVQGQNSGLVFYQTCLQEQGKNQLCVEQSFLWGNP